jgi:hypothetical protein
MQKFDDKQEKSGSVIEVKCTICGSKLYIDELLSKYGPEGLYELAEQLKSAADADVADGMSNNFFE